MQEVMKSEPLAQYLPVFLRHCYQAAKNSTLLVAQAIPSDIMNKFLEFCYCDKVLNPITGFEA